MGPKASSTNRAASRLAGAAASTPRPWVIPAGEGNEHVICEGGNPNKSGHILFILNDPRGTSRVLDFRELAADAELIVRAVNAHDDMLAALRHVLARSRSLQNDNLSECRRQMLHIEAVASAAIAKAEAVGDRTDEAKTAAGA